MITTATNQWWSSLINIILHSYFSELTTTCVLWHKDYELLHWPSVVNFNVYLHINPLALNESFAKDVHNFAQQDAHYKANGIYYDAWTRKYVAAIQQANCEGFVVFQDDIPKFAETYRKASLYSIWRSTDTRFLFIYTKENQTEDYFQDLLFKNFVNILVIESDFKNSTQFSLKTNKFVGSLYQQPLELVYLSTYNALTETFDPKVDLYPKDKLQDLQGRELIVAAFDYRPFVVVDFQRSPQYYDYSQDNPRHLAHVNGTEMHIVHTFCELYNCTVQVDTSEMGDWGIANANYTGTGLVGMIDEGKVHMALGGMFAWYNAYATMDMTTFLGRSGITCLVPSPTRITSWTLPTRPFQFTLWLAIFSCLFLETVALLLARHFEGTLVERREHATWWSSIQFGYVTTMKLFVSQGSDCVVSSHTVRTLLFSCYMIDIIITSIYGGGLASILTLPSLEEVADSVERLYRHNITWMASSYAWVESIDKEDEGPVDPVVARIVNNFRVHTIDEMRSMAKTENMGFGLERLAFGHFANSEYITPEALDHLKLMVDDIYYQLSFALVSRLWPHLPKYNDLILAWHSSGLSKFWEWKITAVYLNANEQNRVEASKYTNFDNGPVKLDMKNFAGLMLLWLVGMAASILVFAGEWLVYWAGKRWARRHQVKVVEVRVVEEI